MLYLCFATLPRAQFLPNTGHKPHSLTLLNTNKLNVYLRPRFRITESCQNISKLSAKDQGAQKPLLMNTYDHSKFYFYY